MTRVLGAVLAGGASSRFGSDKAQALWHGLALADHAASGVAAHVDAIVRVGGIDGVPDRPAPGLGPLGGIAGALAFARANGFGSVLTIGCDMPRLPGGLIADLLRRAPAFCADVPVLGHWPAELAEDLAERLVGDGERSVRRWARAIGALPIAAAGPIANVNTQADLASL